MGSRVLVSVGAGAALGAVVLACAFLPITSGCFGHQCDFSSADFGKEDGGEGDLLPGDPSTWQTTPIAGNWVPYPHNHTVVIRPYPLIGRTITNVIVYISPNQNADAPGSNFTTAAGNLGEVAVFQGRPNDPKDPGAINVHNDTCADFFMRAVITSGPLNVFDAGADAANDAPTDADEGGN